MVVSVNLAGLGMKTFSDIFPSSESLANYSMNVGNRVSEPEMDSFWRVKNKPAPLRTSNTQTNM